MQSLKTSQLALIILISGFSSGFLWSLSSHAEYRPSRSSQLEVELQWAVCEPSAAAVVNKLQFAPALTASYSMHYFDSSDLKLRSNGVSAHAVRKTKKKGKTASESKIKIEFASEDEIDWDWLSGKDSSCEYDRYGTTTLLRCTLESEMTAAQSVWSTDQINFVARFRPGLSLKGLRTWGPYAGRELKLTHKGTGLELSLDEMVVKGLDEPLLEMSVHAAFDQADEIGKQMNQLFTSRGVQLCPEQTGKFNRIIQRNTKSSFWD